MSFSMQGIHQKHCTSYAVASDKVYKILVWHRLGKDLKQKMILYAIHKVYDINSPLHWSLWDIQGGTHPSSGL